MNSRFIEVIDALGLDNERLWLYIPGFNGYEVSLDGYLRSMKHWRKYPTGLLIKPKRNNRNILYDDKGNPIFEISNNRNERVNVTIPDLMKLALENTEIIAGYPRKTYMADPSSRNMRAFIYDENHSMPKFTVTKETESKICPIFDLLGRGLNYGRQ